MLLLFCVVQLVVSFFFFPFRGSETFDSDADPRTTLVTFCIGKRLVFQNDTKTNTKCPLGWISYGLVFIFRSFIEAKRSIMRPEF